MVTNTNITTCNYLESLQLFVFPQIDDTENEDQILFQQDGAPPAASITR